MKQDIPASLLAAKSNLYPPDNHHVPYDSKVWHKWFAEDTDFNELTQRYPQQISRSEVAELAGLSGSGIPRKVFLATMLWGYGTVGYGAYRTSIMVKVKGFQNIIEKSFSLVSDGKYIDAYEMFYLPMCGPAFFTKYFYFVGLGNKTMPLPLILDSVVANSLTQLGVDIYRLARVVKNSAGKITSVARYADGYFQYVEMINSWASEISCRPDSIEKWLFSSRN
ncbi:hypothetical protein ANAEL_05903 [Anaerolineales bacterium]|nr:hypothetical protein ANAEL_05903 [Anaerolineales bacterium]